MKKLVVVSDIHGATVRLRQVLRQEPDMDYLIFLGDGEKDMFRVIDAGELSEGKVYAVRGNCDYMTDYPLEGLIAFEGVLFFYTHGHAYRVKYDLDYFAGVVQNRGADVGLFGHTHSPTLLNEEYSDLPTLFNPGSLGFGGSYGIITVDEGRVLFAHKTAKA